MSSTSCSFIFLPGPLFTSNFGMSPSASLSSFPRFQGTIVTHSRFAGSHRSCSWILRTVLTYFTVFVSSSMITNSLLFTLTPMNKPCPHLALIFSMTFPGGCFHMTFSPNSNPITSALLPFTRSYGVLPSLATSMRFIK